MRIHDDVIVEGNETFSFTLSSISGGGSDKPVLGNSAVTTTIIDDDTDAHADPCGHAETYGSSYRNPDAGGY